MPRKISSAKARERDAERTRFIEEQERVKHKNISVKTELNPGFHSFMTSSQTGAAFRVFNRNVNA